jgi:hypothetical protein
MRWPLMDGSIKHCGNLNKKGCAFLLATFLLPGGAEGDRTPDLMNAIHARSQLRHSPQNNNEFLIFVKLSQRQAGCQSFFLDRDFTAPYNFLKVPALLNICDDVPAWWNW